MGESENRFTSVMRKVAKDGKVNSREAEELLHAFENTKQKNLRYTKEELGLLRGALGIKSSREKFFGDMEVQVLRKLVNKRVSDILEGKSSSASPSLSGESKRSTNTPEIKKQEAQPSQTNKPVTAVDQDPRKMLAIEKLKKTPGGIPSVQFKEMETSKKNKPLIAKEEILLARSNYEKYKVQIWPTIQKIAPLVGLKPKKILAICAQESRFDPVAMSKMGAQGLMQVMPGTSAGVISHLKNGTIKKSGPEEKYYATVREAAKEKGFDVNQYIESSTDLGKNITVGIIYLSYLLKNHKDDRALQIYNGGTGKSLESRKYASGVNAWEKVILVANDTETKVA